MLKFKSIILIIITMFLIVMITNTPAIALDSESQTTSVASAIASDSEVESTVSTSSTDIPKFVKTPLETISLSIDTSNPSKEVPLYYQDDYPDTKFSQGTVATSGCSMACLAMVATYLTDTEYLPDELAERFNDSGTSNVKRFEAGSEELGLPLDKVTYHWGTVVKALKNKQVVVAWVDENSAFTDFGHFIVLTGITDDGKILVNDPFKKNYKNIYLKKGFKNGFEHYRIEDGLRAAWIYEAKPKTSVQLADVFNVVPDE